MKSRLKKGIAYILATVLAISVIPHLPRGIVQAAGSQSSPEITSYATKEQLMTVFDLDGVNDTVGKLVFGRNGVGDENEWYIAGKDSGAAGDNVVLFAAGHLLAPDSLIRFENSYDIKSYSADWGCRYVGTVPKEVYATHYGASMLRAKYLDIVSNGEEGYFSSGEKALMNFTTITNRDTKNHADYTTTDKLYALQGYPELDSKKIFAGSNADMPIAEKYCLSESFHLRTPYLGFPDLDQEYVACCSYYAGGSGLGVRRGLIRFPAEILPATNLNLSSVLFASSVPNNSAAEAKGTIAGGAAMRIRMDGASAIASTVTISKNVIKLSPAAGETVTLVVQGNDGTNDWYYSMPVSGTEMTLTPAEINTACSFLSGNPDFSVCKIWIETAGADGLIYAKNAKTEIQTVDVTVTAPSAGQAFSPAATCTAEGIGKVSDVTWTPAVKKVEYNTDYTASVTLTPADAYVFSQATAATVNAGTGITVLNADGTLTVSRSFYVPSEVQAVTDASITTQTSEDVKGAVFNALQARSKKLTGKSVTLKWKKVSGADGYKVYGNQCGKKNRYKLIKDLGKNKTSYTQKKLKKGTYYKYVVAAYKVIDGKKVTVAVSKTIHAATTGGKYGVAKSVQVNKNKVTLKKGKKFTIKAKEVKKDKTIKHHRKIAYESDNPEVATVSKKGVVKAKKKGSCYIYVYAQNGVYKRVRVTVK